MKHRSRPPEQADLLRPRLLDMIDGRHELVRLAALIDWSWFEREWAGFFPSDEGRPATHPRLVAGLMYLQHAFGLSDEAVVARWVENPYFQHFTGETIFQHRSPIHPSSLSRWRGRIGEEGVEWLLTKTIEAGRASGAVTPRSLSEVAVDTTVMEKAIAHPTDSRLYEKARRSLVGLAEKAGIALRQNHNRLAPPLAAHAGAHAPAPPCRRLANGGAPPGARPHPLRPAPGGSGRTSRPCPSVPTHAQGAAHLEGLHGACPARHRSQDRGGSGRAAASAGHGQDGPRHPPAAADTEEPAQDPRPARAGGGPHLPEL